MTGFLLSFLEANCPTIDISFYKRLSMWGETECGRYCACVEFKNGTPSSVFNTYIPSCDDSAGNLLKCYTIPHQDLRRVLRTFGKGGIVDLTLIQIKKERRNETKTVPKLLFVGRGSEELLFTDRHSYTQRNTARCASSCVACGGCSCISISRYNVVPAAFSDTHKSQAAKTKYRFSRQKSKVPQRCSYKPQILYAQFIFRKK